MFHIHFPKYSQSNAHISDMTSLFVIDFVLKVCWTYMQKYQNGENVYMRIYHVSILQCKIKEQGQHVTGSK